MSTLRPYADTTVPASRSQDEIKKLLRGLVHIVGWNKTRLAMGELFQQVFGLKDKAMQKNQLVSRPRKELETFLKFVLDWQREDKLR